MQAEMEMAAKTRTKICPRCGEELFADMDVCYGCLYDFGRESAPPALPEPSPSAGETGRLELADPTVELGSCDLALLLRSAEADARLPLPENGLVIGRSPESDVVLHSRAVSRRHLKLTPQGASVLAEDLGATNAAMVAGRAICGAARLALGDTVDICGTRFTVVQRGS